MCRLPFISSSASPLRTISTAFAAAAWLCGTSTIVVLPRSRPLFFATSRIFAAGPTRMGVISCFAPASSAPARAVSSHGCTTAVGTGSRLRHRSSRARTFRFRLRAPLSSRPFVDWLTVRANRRVPGPIRLRPFASPLDPISTG